MHQILMSWERLSTRSLEWYEEESCAFASWFQLLPDTMRPLEPRTFPHHNNKSTKQPTHTSFRKDKNTKLFLEKLWDQCLSCFLLCCRRFSRCSGYNRGIVLWTETTVAKKTGCTIIVAYNCLLGKWEFVHGRTIKIPIGVLWMDTVYVGSRCDCLKGSTCVQEQPNLYGNCNFDTLCLEPNRHTLRTTLSYRKYAQRNCGPYKWSSCQDHNYALPTAFSSEGLLECCDGREQKYLTQTRTHTRPKPVTKRHSLRSCCFFFFNTVHALLQRKRWRKTKPGLARGTHARPCKVPALQRTTALISNRWVVRLSCRVDLFFVQCDVVKTVCFVVCHMSVGRENTHAHKNHTCHTHMVRRCRVHHHVSCVHATMLNLISIMVLDNLLFMASLEYTRLIDRVSQYRYRREREMIPTTRAFRWRKLCWQSHTRLIDWNRCCLCIMSVASLVNYQFSVRDFPTQDFSSLSWLCYTLTSLGLYLCIRPVVPCIARTGACTVPPAIWDFNHKLEIRL